MDAIPDLTDIPHLVNDQIDEMFKKKAERRQMDVEEKLRIISHVSNQDDLFCDYV